MEYWVVEREIRQEYMKRSIRRGRCIKCINGVVIAIWIIVAIHVATIGFNIKDSFEYKMMLFRVGINRDFANVLLFILCVGILIALLLFMAHIAGTIGEKINARDKHEHEVMNWVIENMVRGAKINDKAER